MSPYCSSISTDATDPSNSRYDLFGVINHSGTAWFGHYTADARLLASNDPTKSEIGSLLNQIQATHVFSSSSSFRLATLWRFACHISLDAKGSSSIRCLRSLLSPSTINRRSPRDENNAKRTNSIEHRVIIDAVWPGAFLWFSLLYPLFRTVMQFSIDFSSCCFFIRLFETDFPSHKWNQEKAKETPNKNIPKTDNQISCSPRRGIGTTNSLSFRRTTGPFDTCQRKTSAEERIRRNKKNEKNITTDSIPSCSVGMRQKKRKQMHWLRGFFFFFFVFTEWMSVRMCADGSTGKTHEYENESGREKG